MVVYIDLDGTVTNVWSRYYSVMKDFLSLNSIDFVDINEYILKKRQLQNDIKIILDLTGYKASPELYSEFKKKSLESDYYLNMDTVIEDFSSFCKHFHSKNSKIILISLRNSKKGFYNQIHKFGFDKIVDEAVVLEPKPGTNAKYNYLVNKTYKKDIIIGDSPIDIECGNELGMQSWHVNSGLFSHESILLNYKAETVETYMDIILKINK